MDVSSENARMDERTRMNVVEQMTVVCPALTCAGLGCAVLCCVGVWALMR